MGSAKPRSVTVLNQKVTVHASDNRWKRVEGGEGEEHTCAWSKTPSCTGKS